MGDKIYRGRRLDVVHRGVQRRNQYPRDKAVKTRPVEPMEVASVSFITAISRRRVLPARPVFISVELIRNLKHKGIISSTEKHLIKPPRGATKWADGGLVI
jgi:hypothetical protein